MAEPKLFTASSSQPHQLTQPITNTSNQTPIQPGLAAIP
jgi:hypothetical protein